MSRLSSAATLLLAGAIGLLMSGPVVSGSAAATPSPRTPENAIQHVVLIYQENHSFDNVLGAVCQTRNSPCDGYTGPVTLADGITAPNIVQPDIVPDVQHNPDSQEL